jgi:hypothetical protein
MPTAEERANQREEEFDAEEQRRSAYERGTAVRVAKAKLKRELKQLPTVEGLFLVADIIEKKGRYEAATPVELISACHNIGPARAERITAGAGILPTVKLRDIAPVRREAIAFDVRRLAYTRRPYDRPKRHRNGDGDDDD